MILVNDVSKQIFYSRGKNATTSISDPLQAKDPDWYIPDDSEKPFPYGRWKDYTCYVIFREPRQRYISGLLEDISMLMMDGHETLSYYQKIIDDKEQAVLSSKTLSNGRTAVLMVDKTEEYFIHILQQVLKYNNYDYGFGDSYHMCNWLWHGFAMQSICDKTIWIDLPNLNSYMLKHFDLELQYLNTKIPRDKHLLNNAINKSRFRDPIHNYLINETNLYDIIMKYRNEDYTLKDLKENPIDAEKISNAVFNEYNNIQNIKQKEEIVRQFIWLIFQKHWGQN